MRGLDIHFMQNLQKLTLIITKYSLTKSTCFKDAKLEILEMANRVDPIGAHNELPYQIYTVCH